MVFTINVFVSVVVFIGTVTAWSYTELDLWPGLCQTGEEQSPVALSRKTSVRTLLPPLQLTNYNETFAVTIENNGYTVEIKIPDNGDNPTLSGGYLDGEYVLDNIHFHWKSEHTINGRSLQCRKHARRYPLEGHFVHYNKEDYGTLADAIGQPNGIIVLGVMFEQYLFTRNNLKDIVEATKLISKTLHVPTEIRNGLKIDNILPKKQQHYYTYSGSLTTPDCNENVTWIVFDNTLTIRKDQLKPFYEVVAETGEPLRQNYRPLQKLYGRKIVYV